MRTFGPARQALDENRFAVVVIGGGINGVAIARECARAGRSTLIVEQHDFGSGTTSRSTRIIHGGLRYLEHGEISLVRESLRERERLLRERPHLVCPIEFLLALDKQGSRNALQIRFGLWLYRKFGRAHPDGHRPADVTRFEQLLDSGRQWALFSYEDAQCEFPERLVAEWLREAVTAGALARNYTEVLEVKVTGGRARGVVLRDLADGVESYVEASHIINATGPWADRMCRQSRIDTRTPLIGGVRGAHLVLPKFSGAPETPIYAEASDGRPIFVVPWNGQILLGTTETADDLDPGSVQASDAEIEYLFDSLLDLFPDTRLTPNDIRCAFAGVRPLPFAPGTTPASVTRRHFLHDHASDGAAGMISVIGGKLTTAASLARACARKIGIAVAEPHSVGIGISGDDRSLMHEWSRQVSAETGITRTATVALAEWHGPEAASIAQMASGDELLRQTLCPHTPHLVAEALNAVEKECALTLADILLRRVPVALGPCWSEQCARKAAGAIGGTLGWSELQTAAQLEAFETERQQFLRAPQRVSPRKRAPSMPRQRAA